MAIGSSLVNSSYGVLRMNSSSHSPALPTMWLRNVAGMASWLTQANEMLSQLHSQTFYLVDDGNRKPAVPYYF
jgi:hypothetical protein